MLVGRSDCSIIKNPHFGSPLHFFKIFFLDLVPPSKKITNANTNTKIIFWRQTKTDKMTCIFFIGRWLQIWHLVDSLLTPCWHLSDTLLTPCWSFFQMCNCTIVTTWQSFALPFFHCQIPLQCLSSIAKCSHAKWIFSSCRDLILSSDLPNVHGDYWAFSINIDLC